MISFKNVYHYIASAVSRYIFSTEIWKSANSEDRYQQGPMPQLHASPNRATEALTAAVFSMQSITFLE